MRACRSWFYRTEADLARADDEGNASVSSWGGHTGGSGEPDRAYNPAVRRVDMAAAFASLPRLEREAVRALRTAPRVRLGDAEGPLVTNWAGRHAIPMLMRRCQGPWLRWCDQVDASQGQQGAVRPLAALLDNAAELMAARLGAVYERD